VKKKEAPISTDPVYQRLLGKYVELLKDYAADGIDAQEAQTLYDISSKAQNPEIRFFFEQLVAGGSFVTRHNSQDGPGDRDGTLLKGVNLCLNFSEEPRQLYCASLGIFDLSYDVFEQVNVPPSRIRWQDPKIKREVALKIKGETLSSLQAIERIRRHITNTSMVENLIPKAFEGCVMPELAMVVSGVLLNVFALSEGIDDPTRQLYGSMVSSEVKRVAERILKEVESLGLDPRAPSLFRQPDSENLALSVVERPAVKDFYDTVQANMNLAEAIHASHVEWVKSRFPEQAYKQYELFAKNDRETLGKARNFYASWMNLRVYSMNPQYLESINKSQGGMEKIFSRNADDVYERFWFKCRIGGEESDLPEWGILGGFLAGSRFASGVKPGFLRFLGKVGIYIPPIVGGMVAECSLRASSEVDERLPVPFFLPRLWGVPAYLPQDDFKPR